MKENNIPRDSRELAEALKLGAPGDSRDIDYSKLKYVIYARKSTTGDERQETSIPDQINECIKRVVDIDELNVVGEPIEEKCSAKDPDIRQKFSEMIEDIKKGKIDGIISWHPDRLSRNMKEAGIIIDLLDKGVLKDLRFATSSFENSPTGKMLLGISFVLSKQYSEHLSESVTRGNRNKTEAGIFFDDMKHGYVITDDGRLVPDGENYKVIRQLFEKRMEGQSQAEIAVWLNNTNYKIQKKNKAPTKYKWSKDRVSKTLKDPLYAGVLKYGNSYSNLEDFYDFTPVVTVEEFFKINKISDFTSSKLVSSLSVNKRKSTKADLLRGIVYCGYCNKSVTSGLTSKKLKAGEVHYYLYRCENEECEFRGKSFRAHWVLNHAYNFLSEHLFTTESNYQQFVEDAESYTSSKRAEIRSSMMSLAKPIGDKKSEYDRAKEAVLKNEKLKDHYDLDKIKQELTDLENRMTELKKERSNLSNSVITYKKYLELFENISVKLKKTDDMKLLDQVLRKFFSNFTVKATGKGKQQRCEITHKLNEPWSGFIKTGDFVHGRGERT